MTASLALSHRARHTDEQPISYFMQQAVENPNLISLAAGLVDAESLPAADVDVALRDIFAELESARAALQYGTTQGYLPLREKILDHAAQLDGLAPRELGVDVEDVVVTTGSQQLLYLLGETLLDPGDVVITEAPSYFVYQSALNSFGVRTLQVPMDEEGMDTAALETLLKQLDQSGNLRRVKMIYTVDYFQNPTGLTLSLPRRRHLMDLVRRYSKHHRLLVLEDAAYRELRYEGNDVPSLKSMDEGNQHVLLAMTFSKPLAPGLKTGYGLLPRDVAKALLRFKGNHDFGSSNLCQHLLDRLLGNGSYHRQAERLRVVYRRKRDAMLQALAAEFPEVTGARWTHPEGGLYVWLTCPVGVPTGPGSPLMKSALREGVLYVPGEFCYEKGSDVPRHEARLCFGVAEVEQIREAIRRLARAARDCGLPRLALKAFAGCRG
jgi:2-aminoadipate transaminase